MQGTVVGYSLRYWLTLITGLLECLLFAGLVFGHASLVFVLKKEEYFGWLCVNTNSTTDSKDCSGQDEQFSLVFTVASFLNNFLTLLNGYIFDHCGTLLTRLLAIALFSGGTLLVALSSPEFSNLLYPALSLLAVGGVLLLITNMQVGNLFPAHRSTIITFYNGAFDSSSAVLLIVKVGLIIATLIFVTHIRWIKQHCPHTSATTTLLKCSFILICFLTFRINCGKGNTDTVEETEIKEGPPTQESPETENTSLAPEGRTEAQNTEKVQSFGSCVKSRFFIFHLVWLSIMQLRHYFFIGTLNSMLNRLADGDSNLVSQYTNAFAITQLCGILCAPWNGLIMDRHKKKPLAPGETEQEADLRSSYLSLLLTALQCLLFSVCTSIAFLPLQYFTFILQVLNRSFLYGGNAAFLSIAFPACHFGKLYGLVMAVSAGVSVLQYPLVSVVREYPFYVDISLIFLTLLAFIHPTNVFIHCRKQGRLRKDHPENRARHSSHRL
ncbi:solute carrier family 43 member 3-like [Pundamilia nyererei]|uniref:Solute carrier family 43 member 3-like n=1 Tax=Pundamilia nyererei TaxID=303518 RepID=A0A9Y3RBM0_9CICH|nr:PREDICTED: solute carrier family 43 member 3-like [Pundamilia nyererei]